MPIRVAQFLDPPFLLLKPHPLSNTPFIHTVPSPPSLTTQNFQQIIKKFQISSQFALNMADLTIIDVDPPPRPLPTPPDFDSGLLNDGVALDDIDFDFSFDEFGDLLLFSDEFGSMQQPDLQHGSDPGFHQFAPNFDQLTHAVFKSSPELRHLSTEEDRSSNGSGVLTSESPEMEISGYLNVPSTESNGSNPGNDGRGLDCASPESQGSGNGGSNASENSNSCGARSVSSSPDSSNCTVKVGVVHQKIKLEDLANCNNNNKVNGSLLKRKKVVEDSMNNNNGESRTTKYRKSNCNNVENNDNNAHSSEGLSEEDEKKKARLMRNRESAQLSRQRKKHYVEELEDKVKNMHATIQDLNSKISYFMAENATLRQQVGGGSSLPPPVALPPPGMYPHPAMMYPWMPCPPPYMMKPHSQVPLVPIPKLKPQQPAPAPKVSKKADSKKNEGPKTKKVASVSFLGLLFFVMLFGGLVPMVNVRYGGVREAFSGGFYEKHRGRVLTVNGTEYGGHRRDFSCNISVDCGKRGNCSDGDPSADEHARLRNGSEPLTASLYVPRNDKLVKIDGNLIIHSVLASEKAMSSHGKKGVETSLAVPGDLSSSIPVQGIGRNGARHPQLRALGSRDKDNLKSAASDGKLQQWFREGLAGPMLSSGMCTEVFQFDVSSAIVPAAAGTSRNISKDQNQNSTHLTKGRNRRILHGLPIPIPGSSHNISKEHAKRNPQKDNLNGNNNSSSMVVSVLVDPREGGDSDADSVMGTKSLSRIFVVVLIDSVKYVTYSCMLPFMGSAPHLMS